MIFQPFYFLNLNLFWSKSTTNNVRFLLFPDIENTAAYLLELLDLRLLKHGEDVGASLLSSPLSLIWGLLTRLGKQPQAPNAEFVLSVRQGQHSNQSAVARNTAQTEKTVPKTAFHLFYFLLPIGATEGRNSLTMSEWWNVDSQQRCDAGVGFMSGLISHAPIIACGGHRSPLHGRGGAALIRGEADWIPQSWKIETRGATTDSEWPLVSDTLINRARCVCLVGAISEFDAHFFSAFLEKVLIISDLMWSGSSTNRWAVGAEVAFRSEETHKVK